MHALALLVTAVVAGHTQLPSAPRIPTAVGFFKPREGLLSFSDGSVLRTDDGGRTWKRARVRGFSAIDVVSRRVAFAVRGRSLLGTRDEGRAWRRIAALPRRAAIDFADARHGWLLSAAGPRATSDGGHTWRRLRVPCPLDETVELALADPRRGFALCGGQPATIEQGKRLYATTDGGGTWRLRATSRSFGEPRAPGVISSQGHVAGMVFRDARHGIVIAHRIGLYATSDGGLHWRTALFTDPFVAAVAWPSPRVTYALLMNSELARRDGTRGWRVVYPHTLPQPNTFVFADGLHGVGLGRADLRYDPGAVLATDDGGRTWRARGQIPGAGPFPWLLRGPNGDLYAVGLSSVFRSRDGGRTWTRARRSPSSRAAFELRDNTVYQARRELAVPLRPIGVATLGRSHAWIVAAAAPCAHPNPNCPGAIFRTDDGGRRWLRISLNMVPAASEIDFVSPRVGYAKDPWTPLYRTRDGGRTWQIASTT